MVYKRLFGYGHHEEEGEGSIRPAKQQRPVLNFVRGAFGLPSGEVLKLHIEPFFRKVVQEEVGKILLSSMRSGTRISIRQIDEPVTRRYKLQFKSALPNIIFAGSKIKAYDNSMLQICITDARTNEIITTGPLSSLKVEMVAIDGDFCCDSQEWSEQEFTKSLLREREGKRPLLTGELVVSLSKGISYFGDLTFTDNSSWVRSRHFRLGARVLQSSSLREDVQEARSDAFVVKDHRGEFYKKHHPPLLDDEVWRLEKIRKDGTFQNRLNENGINTVQHFLRLFVVNSASLRSILGNCSNKVWDAIVQHAKECKVENTPYCFYNVVEQQVTLYFNSIFELAGVKFEGCPYQSFSEDSEATFHLKENMERLKEHAYRNWSEVVVIDKLPFNPSGPLHKTDAGHPISIPSNQQDSFIPIMQKDQNSSKNRFTSSCALPNDSCQGTEIFDVQEHYPVQQSLPSASGYGTVDFLQYNDFFPCTSEWNSVTNPLVDNDSLVKLARCLSVIPELEIGDGFFHPSETDTHSRQQYSITLPGAHATPTSKWFMLLTTLKCGMCIRKCLAAKRRERIPLVTYPMYPSFQKIFETC